MQFTASLLTALLAPSVALAYRHDCTQMKVTYRSSGPNPGAFTENTNNFYSWAARNGGACQGWCDKVEQKGNVHEMVCWAPRMNRGPTGIPYPAALTEIVQPIERKCDVHCTLGDSNRSCAFAWGCCHGYEPAACFG